MRRRDFLHPRHFAHAAGQVLAAVDELRAPEVENQSEDYSLIHFGRRAMATTFEILLPFATPHALEASEAALNAIDRLEEQLTVYSEESELSRLNRLASVRPVAVEKRLFDLIVQAGQLTRDTGGAFDISVGALIKVWGFNRRRGRVPDDAERAETLRRIGMHHVALDKRGRTVRYSVSGLEINLGSIGKGYALDRAAEILSREWEVTSGVLHGGHSSILALGVNPADGRGWPIALRHPWKPERHLAVVRLANRAMGTSAATFQHLEYNGRKLGHILDPRNGWPAEGVALASVLAPTAAIADALATAFFILGVEKARLYCEAHRDIGAILLPAGFNVKPIVFGIAPGDIDLVPPKN